MTKHKHKIKSIWNNKKREVASLKLNCHLAINFESENCKQLHAYLNRNPAFFMFNQILYRLTHITSLETFITKRRKMQSI